MHVYGFRQTISGNGIQIPFNKNLYREWLVKHFANIGRNSNMMVSKTPVTKYTHPLLSSVSSLASPMGSVSPMYAHESYSDMKSNMSPVKRHYFGQMLFKQMSNALGYIPRSVTISSTASPLASITPTRTLLLLKKIVKQQLLQKYDNQEEQQLLQKDENQEELQFVQKNNNQEEQHLLQNNNNQEQQHLSPTKNNQEEQHLSQKDDNQELVNKGEHERTLKEQKVSLLIDWNMHLNYEMNREKFVKLIESYMTNQRGSPSLYSVYTRTLMMLNADIRWL